MALLAEHVPEHRGKFVGLVIDADLLGALDESILRVADGGDAGEIALDVGSEHGNTGAGKPFREHLQRHGLAGAGRAGHQSMPIGKLQRQIFRLRSLADENPVICIDVRHCAAPCVFVDTFTGFL